MKCPVCNETISPDSEKCPRCGHNLTGYKKCVSCGELLDEDDLYCPYCGEKQIKNNSIVVQLPQNKESKKVEERSVTLIKTTDEIDEKELWDKRIKTFVIIFCVLSLIILCILLISH